MNAVSPKGRFGGGDLTTTDDDAMAPYLEQLLPEVFGFYRTCGAALAERGGGTLVQVTGGSARRALPGRAPWAAGAAGVRALSQAAANELKPQGVHAALLVCDGSFGTPGDDAGGEQDRPGRAGQGRAVPARAGPKRVDARAGGHAGRRPLDALAGDCPRRGTVAGVGDCPRAAAPGRCHRPAFGV